MSLRCDALSRLARVELVLYLLIAWSGRPQQILAAQAGNGSGTSQPDPRQSADEMKRRFDALEAAEKKIPRDTFDPEAVADQVGHDPLKLFDWVRFHTFWVPYRGALRSPGGVLMDRLGNTLDRSLLLAELLRQAGFNVRLSRAQLTEQQASALLARIPAVPADPLQSQQSSEPEEESLKQLLRTYDRDYHLDAAKLRNAIDAAQFESQKLAEDLVGRVDEQVSVLAEAAGSPDSDAAAARDRDQTARQLDALRDHWWVSYQKDKNWVDLDLFADAPSGPPIAQAAENLAPDARDGRFHLDARDCHELTIRVVIEQCKTAGPAVEKKVLEHTLRPADAQGKHILLGHVPMHWPKDFDPMGAPDPVQKVTDQALAEDEWLPVLRVGDDSIYQSSFNDAGDTHDGAVEQLAIQWGFQGAGARVGNMLRGGGIGRGADEGGRAPPAPAKSDAHLTAEWIEYEIRAPGESAGTIRRQLFDLRGPAARSAGPSPQTPHELDSAARLDRAVALLGQTEILVLGGQPSAAMLADQSVRAILAARAGLSELLDPDSNQAPSKRTMSMQLLPSPALANFALLRLAWSRWRDQTYQASMNIFTQHLCIRRDADNNLVGARAIDIVANDIAIRPGSKADPFRARLEQGVIDTNVESLVMSGFGAVENTSQLFVASAAQDIGWVTINGPDDAAWQGVQLPADVRARIEAQSKAGAVVIVPRTPVLHQGKQVVGWWQIDPVTGQTLGMGESGWGQSATEKTLIIGTVLFVVGGAACIFLAGRDNRVSYRDVEVCTAFALGGYVAALGVATAAAGAGVLTGIILIAAFIFAMLGTGQWLRTDSGPDEPFWGGSPSAPGAPGGTSTASGTPTAAPSATPSATPSASPTATPKASPTGSSKSSGGSKTGGTGTAGGSKGTGTGSHTPKVTPKNTTRVPTATGTPTSHP